MSGFPAKRHAVALLGACSLLLGCGGDDGRAPVHPVSGEILVDGRPAEGVTVVLHPVGAGPGEAGARPNKPVGRTGADGRFRVTTYDAYDGAPAGEYVVTMAWSEPGVPDRLGGRYRLADRSEFRATVGEGENRLPPFDLKGMPASPRGPGARPRADGTR